jgi:hypothetical protein
MRSKAPPFPAQYGRCVGYIAETKTSPPRVISLIEQSVECLDHKRFGGLELKAFAEAHSGWSFDGIDPAAEMLKTG